MRVRFNATTQYHVASTEYCCKQLENWLELLILWDVDGANYVLKMPAAGIVLGSPVLNYCPFCGRKVEYVQG